MKEVPVDCRNVIQVEQFDPPDSSSFQMLCSNLRYLKIGINFILTKTVIETLNGLTKLEELILESVSMKDDSRAELSLPNLKVLSVEDCFQSFKLIINSKLEKLYYGCCFFVASEIQIKLNHPEHLIYLETEAGIPKQMPAFKSLRTLRFSPISRRDLKIILKLESLQEIYFKFAELHNGKICDSINFLMEQRGILNRHDLKIYFANILIARPFRTYGFSRLPSFSFSFDALLVSYYRCLPNCLPDHRKIFSFGAMFLALNKRKRVLDEDTSLPECFFRKFPNIQFIRLESSRSQENLVKVLGEFKNLNFLQIKETCQFTQSILDQLPKSCPQLKVFEIKVCGKDKTELVRLNYRPICKLKYLCNLGLCTGLETVQNLQIVLDLFEESRYLAEVKLRFKYNDGKYHCSIEVKRKARNLFSIKYFSFEQNMFKENTEFDGLRDFVGFLQDLVNGKVINFQT